MQKLLSAGLIGLRSFSLSNYGLYAATFLVFIGFFSIVFVEAAAIYVFRLHNLAKGQNGLRGFLTMLVIVVAFGVCIGKVIGLFVAARMVSALMGS